MSYPGGPEGFDPTRVGPASAAGYPNTNDPAYSGYWGPGYYPTGYGVPPTQPTEQLPPYWQPGTGYSAAPPPPPPPPKKSPRWLWAAVAATVLLVAGLVLALVIVSNSSKQSTVVAPATPTTSASPPRVPTVPSRPPRTPSSTMPTLPSMPEPPLPLPFPLPIPTEEPGPTEPGAPGAEPPATGTETVTYNVSGEGRAINITYVDTGGIMQIEFNVALPWSKEVSLAAPARNSASVAVVNVGRDVTCSVSVDGTPVRQRTGRGLTICTGLG